VCLEVVFMRGSAASRLPRPRYHLAYACDRRAQPSEIKNRWSNAALFVSLCHGWPGYDYPAYAVACISKSLAHGSAASRLTCLCPPAPLQGAFLRVRVGSTALALIALRYRLDANKVLDGSIVEREFVLCLMYWVSRSALLCRFSTTRTVCNASHR